MFMQKAAPLGLLGFVHLHEKVQQDGVRDFASFLLPWTSLPAVQARSHDDVRLFTDHLFSHFDSVSRIEATLTSLHAREVSSPEHPKEKMHTCRTKDARKRQYCNGCSRDTHIGTKGQKQLISFVCLNRLLIGQVKVQIIDHFITVIQDSVKVRSRFTVAWWCTCA